MIVFGLQYYFYSFLPFITQVIKIFITWAKRNIRHSHKFQVWSIVTLHWRITWGWALGHLIILNICTFCFSLYYSWLSWLQAYKISFPQTSSVSCNSPSPFWFLNPTGNLEQPAYSCCVCSSGILALESCNFGNPCFLSSVLTAIRQPLKTFLEISQNTLVFILYLVWRNSS